MTFQRIKMDNRVILDLKKRSTVGIIFYIVLSFIVVCADDYHTRHASFALIFVLANAGICLFRLIHLPIAKKMGDRYKTFNKVIFFSSVIVTAMIWGMALGLIMLQKEEHTTQLVLTVCSAGLCAGGVVAFIPNLRLSILFNIAMMTPVVSILLFNRFNMPLAMMIFLYSVYLVLMAYRGNKEYWYALQNEYLLEIKSQEMTRLSNTDVLTDLYNRRFFDLELDKEWKRSGRNKSMISVVLMDIDHFKNINDTYGHQVGDEYLKKTAEILSSVFKRDSDIVARYGGEEFIVLLPEVDVEHALLLAKEAILKIASISIDHQGIDVRTTISAGVNCCIPNFNSRSDSVITGADEALYMAKNSGRNRAVVFTSKSE